MSKRTTNCCESSANADDTERQKQSSGIKVECLSHAHEQGCESVSEIKVENIATKSCIAPPCHVEWQVSHSERKQHWLSHVNKKTPTRPISFLNHLPMHSLDSATLLVQLQDTCSLPEPRQTKLPQLEGIF